MARVHVWVGLSLCMAFGCRGGGGGGPSSGGPMCARAVSQLRSCGLLSQGVLECTEPKDDAELCQANCRYKATCNMLEQALCQKDLSSTFGKCVLACRATKYTCADGTQVDTGARCDGSDDCVDGSDERDCPVDPKAVKCDGLSMPADTRCDGSMDCLDGSDEKDCPMFACADGSSVVLALKCDEHPDCRDGSDEKNCPVRAMLLCKP